MSDNCCLTLEQSQVDVCVCYYLLIRCHFPFTRKTTISCCLPPQWSAFHNLPVTAGTQSRTQGAQHSYPDGQKRQLWNVNEIFQSTHNPPPLLLSSLENAKPSSGLFFQCLPLSVNQPSNVTLQNRQSVDYLCARTHTHTPHTHPNIKSKYDFFSHTCTHTQTKPWIQPLILTTNWDLKNTPKPKSITKLISKHNPSLKIDQHNTAVLWLSN